MQSINLDEIRAPELLINVAETHERFFAVTNEIFHDKVILQGYFNKDSVFIPTNQASAIGPLSDDECRQVIDWALGNLNPCECFWYEPEELSASELEEEREYQKFWHCQPRYSF